MRQLVRVARRKAWELQSTAKSWRRLLPLHGNLVPDSSEIRTRVAELRDKGYTLFENFYSPDDLVRLRSYFESVVTDLGALDYPLDDYTLRMSMDDVQNTREVVKGQFKSFSELLEHAEIRKYQSRPFQVRPDWPILRTLSLHPTLLGIASRYLGIVPVLYNVFALRSLPSRLGFDSNAYHRDQEDPRYMLKFFVYLNDVGEENGPHCFYEGTQSKVYPWQNRATRFTDEEMARELGASKEKVFTGKAGTLIIEDTRGYHKGRPLVKGTRDMYISGFIGRMKPWRLTEDPSIRSFDWNPLERLVLDL